MAALALAAVLAAPAAAAGAAAAGRPTFALAALGSRRAPLLRGLPGQVLHGAVQVRNLTDREVTVLLQPASIGNASNGNAEYETAHVSGAGRWLSLQTSRVRLAAHQSERVSYAISVPAGTSGASHYAGIVATDAAELAQASVRGRPAGRTFTFSRINRQAIPVTVRLPGPLSRAISLRSVNVAIQPDGAALMLGLMPSGSDLIQSTRLRLRVQQAGRTLFSYSTTLGQLFPGRPLRYRVPWNGPSSPGRYEVLGVIQPSGAPSISFQRYVEITAPQREKLERQMPAGPTRVTTSIPDWVWIALGVAALLLAGLSLALARLWRQRASTRV